MLQVITQKRFEKDLEVIKKRGRGISKLNVVIRLLAEGKRLPASNFNHKLKGEWKDCWECHVEPDLLLIYNKTKTEIILIRIGTHSDLFG